MTQEPSTHSTLWPNMRTCPECGCQNPDFALYCIGCSIELNAAAGEAASVVAEPGAAAEGEAAEGPETAALDAEAETAPAAAPPAADPPPEAAAAHSLCPNCGYALQADARFCNECGADVSGLTANG